MSEPRFFIDHGVIHDRKTGKHVRTEPDGWEDGINACCALLNELDDDRAAQLAGECLGIIPGTFVACGEGGNYCSVACHLRGQLASMTKRAEEAEAKLAIEHEANQHDPVRLKLVAAEAKLATAVQDERAKIVRYLRVWADSVRDNEAIDGRLQALVTDTHADNIERGEHITRPAQSTLRDLGVEPGEVGR